MSFVQMHFCEVFFKWTQRHSSLAFVLCIRAVWRVPYLLFAVGVRPKFIKIWKPLQIPIMSLSFCANERIFSLR